MCGSTSKVCEYGIQQSFWCIKHFWSLCLTFSYLLFISISMHFQIFLYLHCFCFHLPWIFKNVERQRQGFCLLAYFSNAPKRQSSARLKPEAWNSFQVSHMGLRDSSPWVIPACCLHRKLESSWARTHTQAFWYGVWSFQVQSHAPCQRPNSLQTFWSTPIFET